MPTYRKRVHQYAPNQNKRNRDFEFSRSGSTVGGAVLAGGAAASVGSVLAFVLGGGLAVGNAMNKRIKLK